MAESLEDSAAGPIAGGAVKSFLAGGMGGVGLVMVGHPFDTIKVRLQTQPKPLPGEEPMFRGTLDCVRSTVKYEGIRGFYRGLLAPLLTVTPFTALNFFGYWVGQRIQKRRPDEILTVVQHFYAGMVGGSFSTIILTATDRVKCTMQIQRKAGKEGKYSGSIDCARQLLKEGGIRNLFRGATATGLRNIPGIGIYFFTYECVMRKLTLPDKSHDHLSPGRVLLAGGTAGVVYWIILIAPDTVKSRIQSAPLGKYRGTGIIEAYRELVHTEGYRALYRGLTPALMRSFPANAACLLLIETTMRVLDLLW